MTKNSTPSLQDQRFKKHLKKTPAARKISLFTLTFSLFGIVILITIYSVFAFFNHRNILTIAPQFKGTPWKISFNVLDDHESGLSENNYERLSKIITDNIGQGNKDDLQRVASILQAQEIFASVHMLKLGTDKLLVTFKRRQPVLGIKVGSETKLLTTDGVVYGKANKELPFPIIYGIFSDESSTYRSKKDSSLDLTEEEETMVKEGLDLYLESTKRGINYRSIDFKKYRGFTATLLPDDTLVVLGRGPFEKKLEHLKQIFSNLESNGKKAARIELDYNGKAFIKEKKISL